MSTTLTNGLKLPDKGSVDWYADMQNNYTILDGAVGTVAEHTTQIAGKASASHTHGKADVTDLFNSANTWSESQTYSTAINYKTSYVLGNLPGNATAQQAFKILESTGTDFICDIASFQNALATGLRFTTKNKMDANGFSPSGTIKAAYLHFLQNAENKGYLQWDGYTKNNVIPLTTNTYDLGSSSYQWNNAYIKSLTINGVACGDILTHNASEFVDVTSNQTIGGIKTFNNIIYGLGGQIILRRNDVERTVLPSSTVYTAFSFNDKSGVGTNSRFGAVENVVKTNGDINLDLRAYDFSTKSNIHTTVVLERKYDGTSNFYPETNNAVNLGTSTNKWKTLNGINPGALSLPKIVAKNTANIASAIVGADGETQYLDGTDNNYTAAVDGWISICISGFVNNELWITVYDQQDETWGTSAESSTRNTMFIIFPVRANQKMRIRMKCTSVTYARFYPCEGNV